MAASYLYYAGCRLVTRSPMARRSLEYRQFPLFEELPDAALLHWLVRGGSLRQNLLRAVRLWVWLGSLYGNESEDLNLTEPFSYKDWRDAFFTATHPKGESIPEWHDSACACAKTVAAWLFPPGSGRSEQEWRAMIQTYSAIADTTLDQVLQSRLFAVTRRSLAGDLEWLCGLGWLQLVGNAYCRVKEFPPHPVSQEPDWVEPGMVGYDLGFLTPHLESIAQELSQPIANEQRFFLEVDYITAQTQDRVEEWLETLKAIWQEAKVPPICLRYHSARYGVVQCVVYPVCVYYVQRAIYLCAMGETPAGQGDWYNYRLDKIQTMERAYYTVLYRDGDTNVGLRLRSWRPKVEVLLPLELRQKQIKELQAEWNLYQ